MSHEGAAQVPHVHRRVIIIQCLINDRASCVLFNFFAFYTCILCDLRLTTSK